MKLKLHTIGIVVDDLKASLDFYRVLGLEIPETLEDIYHYEYTNSDGYSIGFIPKSTMLFSNPNWKESLNTRIGLQFEMESPERVNEKYEEIIQKGYKDFKAPWDAQWGQRFAQVLDPDGNSISIFAEL